MDEIEAGAQLIRELDREIPIEIAFWLKEDAEDGRRLYLASGAIDDQNIVQAYGRLRAIVDKEPSLFLDPLDITLIAADDRFAVAAAKIKAEQPNIRGNRLFVQKFGDRYVHDVYIYPTPLTPGFPRKLR